MTKVQAILAITICLLLEANTLADSNCCHIPGSNCQTETEWIQGYYDGVHGRCQTSTAAGLSDTTPQSTPQPAPTQTADRSQHVNNCCFIGWHCESDAQWISGYYAHQAGDACATESQATYQHQPSQRSNDQSDSGSAGSVIEYSDGRVKYTYEDGSSRVFQRPVPPSLSEHRKKVCAALEEQGLTCPL
jgi:hypothetical protein